MASKTPIRAVFNDSNVATGLAEFQTGDFIPLSAGGIGAALSIGTAGQVLKVNSGASALEFGSVEAIVNIDGATDLESATLVAGDNKIAVNVTGSGGVEQAATVVPFFSKSGGLSTANTNFNFNATVDEKFVYTGTKSFTLANGSALTDSNITLFQF